VRLGLSLDDGTLRALSRDIKGRADVRPLALAEVDHLLREAAAHVG
jgi:hypothetical protein